MTLGNLKNPDNTSAFIATRDAALVPLQSQQERFYAFVEDVGLIWLDFIRQYYRMGRMIPLEQDGQRLFVPLPDDVLDAYTMRLKVDVGPSTMWSEVQVVQTLDNLLKGAQITFRQYLERMPDGHIPMREELLDEAKRRETQAAQAAAQQQAAQAAAQMAQAMAPQPRNPAEEGGRKAGRAHKMK